MMKKSVSYILVLMALAAVVSMAGCTAPAQHSEVLQGKDIFDPSKFSMATYAISIGSGQTVGGELIVLSYPGETSGDRLTSIELTGNVSSRMDVWLNRTREAINNGTVTAVNDGSLQVVDMPSSFNVTTMDSTWNTPGSKYTYYGSDNVTVPAGTFENCTIYYGSKTIQFQGSALNMSVVYYMHPSSPVPVLYIVQSSDGAVAYALMSVYGPDNVDSTPARTVQSYFDRISSADYTKAAKLLVTDDGSGLQPVNRTTIIELGNNMDKTYGVSGRNLAVQYVLVDAVQSAGKLYGHDAVTVHWTSIHYSRTPGEVYNIEGTFNMVNDDGWRIIV